jgi:putative transposase
MRFQLAKVRVTNPRPILSSFVYRSKYFWRTSESRVCVSASMRRMRAGIVNLIGHWQSRLMITPAPSYRGYRFPSEIISHAVWLYHRFGVSFRDVEDLLASRGVIVTYEAVRKWCRRFGPVYARRLRRRRGRMGDTWHLDELFVIIQGRQQYLWRAVDEDGDVIDILVQSRRHKRAAVRFFRKLLRSQGSVPRRLVTDKLRSYSAACRTVMPSVVHCTDQYANNRAEVSHQATRQRERQMRCFKSAAQLQRFASVHGMVQNLFRVGRHLLRSAHHRVLRMRAFVEWDAVTSAC